MRIPLISDIELSNKLFIIVLSFALVSAGLLTALLVIPEQAEEVIIEAPVTVFTPESLTIEFDEFLPGTYYAPPECIEPMKVKPLPNTTYYTGTCPTLTDYLVCMYTASNVAVNCKKEGQSLTFNDYEYNITKADNNTLTLNKTRAKRIIRVNIRVNRATRIRRLIERVSKLKLSGPVQDELINLIVQRLTEEEFDYADYTQLINLIKKVLIDNGLLTDDGSPIDDETAEFLDDLVASAEETLEESQAINEDVEDKIDDNLVDDELLSTIIIDIIILNEDLTPGEQLLLNAIISDASEDEVIQLIILLNEDLTPGEQLLLNAIISDASDEEIQAILDEYGISQETYDYLVGIVELTEALLSDASDEEIQAILDEYDIPEETLEEYAEVIETYEYLVGIVELTEALLSDASDEEIQAILDEYDIPGETLEEYEDIITLAESIIEGGSDDEIQELIDELNELPADYDYCIDITSFVKSVESGVNTSVTDAVVNRYGSTIESYNYCTGVIDLVATVEGSDNPETLLPILEYYDITLQDYYDCIEVVEVVNKFLSEDTEEITQALIDEFGITQEDYVYCEGVIESIDLITYQTYLRLLTIINEARSELIIEFTEEALIELATEILLHAEYYELPVSTKVAGFYEIPNVVYPCNAELTLHYYGNDALRKAGYEPNDEFNSYLRVDYCPEIRVKTLAVFTNEEFNYHACPVPYDYDYVTDVFGEGIEPRIIAVCASDCSVNATFNRAGEYYELQLSQFNCAYIDNVVSYAKYYLRQLP